MTKADISPSRNIGEKQILQFVAKKHGIFAAKATPLSGGVESAAWKLEGGNQIWIVKAYGVHEGPNERIEDETKLYKFLQSKGIRVPRVATSKNKKLVEHIKVKGVVYPVMVMVFENLRTTTSGTVEKRDIQEIAKEIARIHKLLQIYPHRDYTEDKRGHSDKVGVKKLSTGEILSKSKNAKAFNPKELHMALATLDRLGDFLQKHPNPKNLKETIIHADLALEHAPFLPDGSVYIFDWADRQWAPIAREIGTFFVHLYREDGISLKRLNQLEQWFLEAYRKVFSLEKADTEAIEYFMLKRIEKATRYLCKESLRLGIDVNSSGIKRRIRLAKILLNH